MDKNDSRHEYSLKSLNIMQNNTYKCHSNIHVPQTTKIGAIWSIYIIVKYGIFGFQLISFLNMLMLNPDTINSTIALWINSAHFWFSVILAAVIGL